MPVRTVTIVICVDKKFAHGGWVVLETVQVEMSWEKLLFTYK